MRKTVMLFLAGAAGASVMTYALTRVGVAQGYAPEQPIDFSHVLHAGENRIPCLYCHFGAETSRHAGIPPSAVCMNCHAQLKVQTVEIAKLKEAVAQARPLVWIKVHNLPDFVYFNHAQHVRVAGLDCRECHGDVETMQRLRQDAPLTMGWCIDCHRRQGFSAGARGELAGLDCSKCHY